MELPIRSYNSNEFKLIPNGNLKLSRTFYAKGTSNIKLNSMNVIEGNVILRGDLGIITIGNSSIIDKDALIRPCLSSSTPPFVFKHVKIGSNCYIGQRSIISAIVIGNNTFIGNDVIVGERVEIGINVRILDGSYIPSDIKLADNSVYGGCPGKHLGENHESMELMMNEYCNNFYRNIIINQVIN